MKSRLTAPDENGRSNQRDQAYQALRRLLILEKVGPGQRLREPEWAANLGVNRAALREAFARLEAEGFIVKGPKTGYFVPVLTDRDIDEIVQVRAALECAAIELICHGGNKNSHPDLKRLYEACDEFELLLERDYFLGVIEADRRFHETLVQLSGNRRLAVIYERAPLPMLQHSVVKKDQFKVVCRRSLQEHRAMLAAITSNDTDEAQRILREHLSHPWENGVSPYPATCGTYEAS